MTNHWLGVKHADIVPIRGGNAGEAHPCGFKWVTEAKAHNKARLIVVDPRFTRSASVADLYVPIRTGTDIAFLGGVISYLLSEDKIQHEYVRNYTDLSFIVREDFAFADGLYSGYNPAKRSYDKSTWDYEYGPDGYVKADPVLAHPRCVYQLMKTHYARYTPEMVERVCGTPKEKFLKVCEMIGSTATPTRAMTIMYALGWTQHSVGSQMIRCGAMMQLLLGNIGVAGGGMNALRGHSNIQGLTDLGLMSNLLPGYITLPGEKEQDYEKYVAARAFKPLRPNQLSYWQNFNKFYVSLMKAWWGDAATRENNWAYDYLPKLDKGYDMLQTFELITRLRALYKSGGGAFPDPIVNLYWPYAVAKSPSPEELAKEYSGRALKDVTDPKNPTQVIRKAGEQLAGFGELRDDGSTLSGCWLYCGAWGPNGNLMARRDNSDPTGIGQTLNWAYSWPANRRVMYNRASCDPSGKPFNPDRKLIAWNGTAWTGADVPDYKADEDPALGMGPFIMNAEGVARFFGRGNLAEGPFPEHYEPFETPLARNPLSPAQEQTLSNPAARVFKDDRAAFGKVAEFPHVATTYRLTEHFHYWTKHVRLNAILQPEQFVEIGEGLAKELGIASGDRVKVSSNRGFIKAVAVVTKRLRTLPADGKPVHTVGIPIHWGFTGLAKPGFLANTLTPVVGDGNSQTPAFKSFLRKVG